MYLLFLRAMLMLMLMSTTILLLHCIGKVVLKWRLVLLMMFEDLTNLFMLMAVSVLVCMIMMVIIMVHESISTTIIRRLFRDEPH